MVKQSFCLRVSHASWMAGCLGVVFFLWNHTTVEIATDINIPEKCLAGLLHGKGEKKEHTCFYKRIIFLLAEDTQWADLILMSFNLSLSFLMPLYSKSAFIVYASDWNAFHILSKHSFSEEFFCLGNTPLCPLSTCVVPFSECQSSYGFNWLQCLIRKRRVSRSRFLDRLSWCCKFYDLQNVCLLKKVFYIQRYL